MQGGGAVELSGQADAAVRAERAARGPARARLTVRSVYPYRGVQKRGDVYVAENETLDDAAKVNYFPEPPSPVPAPGGLGGGAPTARARLLPMRPRRGLRDGTPPARARLLPRLGHARMRVAPQVPAAPVGGGGQPLAFSVQQAPDPHFGAPSVPFHDGATPAFSQLLYRQAAGPAFGVAGGSNGADFHGPALAAAGGSNGAGFYGMAPMVGSEAEVPMLTDAARIALISSDKKNKAVIIESDDEAVVEDNFHLICTASGGASTQAQGSDGIRNTSPHR